MCYLKQEINTLKIQLCTWSLNSLLIEIKRYLLKLLIFPIQFLILINSSDHYKAATMKTATNNIFLHITSTCNQFLIYFTT